MAPLTKMDCNNFSGYDDRIVSSFETKIALPLHPPSSRRRTVGFTEVVTTHSIIHINDYSSEEKTMTWYSRDELHAIRAEAKNIANSSDPSSLDVCLRGLEARTREGARRKRQNRIDARAAVFFEQEMQEDDGFFDADVIADAYFERAEQCHAEAQMLAVRDEKEAMEVYKSIKLSDFASSHGRILLFATPTGSAAA